MDQVEYDVLQSYLVTSRFPHGYTKNQKLTHSAHSMLTSTVRGTNVTHN